MEEKKNQQQAVVNQPTPMAPQPPKKKSGTGKILAVLLALLVLGGVAYGTYYFTKQQAEEDAAAVIVPLQAQVAELEAKLAEMEASDSESAEGSYLEIEQWGVRLTPTDSAMSYTIDGFVKLSNEELKALPGCEDSYGGSLSRYESKQPEGSTPYSTFVKQVGDYYYYAGNPDGTCTQNTTNSSQENLDKELAIRKELLVAAKSVEASEE